MMTKFWLIIMAVLSFVLALIPHILYFIAWLISRFTGGTVHYAPFGWTALCLVVVALAVCLYGDVVGRWNLEVKKVEIKFDSLPSSFDGYKIVHISDLHLISFDGHEENLQRVVDEINSMDADLICFTGDMVSFLPDEVKPHAEILKGLKAKDGVVSVLGNHDFFPYDRSLTDSVRESYVRELIEAERNLGWSVLNNENEVIRRGEDSIFVVGVMNQSSLASGISRVKRGKLKTAMQGVEGFSILLSHDPTHWREEVAGKYDIPLTLSGHTHAAQIKVFGWTPASWTFRDTEGLYNEEAQYMYINTGLGCTAPMRVGVPQEITLITLKR